jgi:hypothetical protein
MNIDILDNVSFGVGIVAIAVILWGVILGLIHIVQSLLSKII